MGQCSSQNQSVNRAVRDENRLTFRHESNDDLKISNCGRAVSRIRHGFDSGRCYGQACLLPGERIRFHLRAPADWRGSLRVGVTSRPPDQPPPGKLAARPDTWLLPVGCPAGRRLQQVELGLSSEQILTLRCRSGDQGQDIPYALPLTSQACCSRLWPVVELLGQPATLKFGAKRRANGVRGEQLWRLKADNFCLQSVPAGARSYKVDSVEAGAANGETCYALAAESIQPNNLLLLQVLTAPKAVQDRQQHPGLGNSQLGASLAFGLTDWGPENIGLSADWPPLPADAADLPGRQPAGETWFCQATKAWPRLLPGDELALSLHGLTADGLSVRLSRYQPGADADATELLQLPPGAWQPTQRPFLVLPPGMAVRCLGLFGFSQRAPARDLGR